ncbi:helix-turn-helix domain-containing protein [Mucilaginibacter terrae]|uniref:helix-turn-helix domain-containing protein n=1 Tax=Mucilaginibacter terrae TaxID=1955052 RepID=UPI00363792E2
MTVNYKMLTLAREARGYTQKELTNAISMQSQGNYSRMEKGILPIPTELIKQIAEELKFPESFFYREEPLVSQAEYFYRKKASMPKKELYKLEATFDLIRMWFNSLLKEVDLPEFKFPEVSTRNGQTPEIIAQKTRAFINAPKGPLDDLIRIFEKNGVIVYFLPNAPETFDGTTIITESNQKVLVVNAEMPNYRKRFTIAHELGHMVMHIPFGSYIEEVIDVENEANRFASEFLMPENEIRRDLLYITYGKLSDLKQYWKASKSSLIVRANALGTIHKGKYINMLNELSRFDERRVEKSDVYLDEPALFKKIIKVFNTDMGYTLEELYEVLGLDKEDFERFIIGNDIRVKRLRISI